MEIRFSRISLLYLVPLVCVLSSSRNQARLEDWKSQEVVKPEFIAEPNDEYVQSNSSVSLFCEARFVFKLKINCSGGLVPEIWLKSEDENNKTLLIVDVSHTTMKARNLARVSCVCYATGYKGSVLKSRPALVALAYLNKDFVILPSNNVRVAKSSISVLRCKPPTGLPIPKVYWEKIDKPLKSLADERIEETKQGNLSLLIIRDAKVQDSGHYRCVASNFVGKSKSQALRLKVYVDGGWSEWHEFLACSASKCGKDKQMLKRSCNNPDPQNGGQFCSGVGFKFEKCRDVCPALEIICPNDTNVFSNHSDTVKNFSWSKPKVINRKNGTNFSVEVEPSWAVPPVDFNTTGSTVITYFARHKYGQTINCSFTITVLNGSSKACLSEDCESATTQQGTTVSTEFSAHRSGTLVLILVCILVMVSIAIVLLRFWLSARKSRKDCEKLAAPSVERFERHTEERFSLINCGDSHRETADFPGKLRAGSPTVEGGEHFEFLPSWKDVVVSAQIPGTIPDVKDNENAPLKVPKNEEKGSNRRKNTSIGGKSTTSEISRMLWNITNLPENIDPNMVACGLVDHNGGKFTIGETGVSLIVPPKAIPEGDTEGIFIGIVNQEKEHPKLDDKESLLSPVVKCGPNGLKFERPVILSLPHCAQLEDGAWNLKVQYNESETGTPAGWKQLIDISKQDGSEPYFALLEPNMVYLMVDHFTNFAVTGQPANQAKKWVQIKAYLTPPEACGDCIVRVYCVGDTSAHLEILHQQETERLGGVTTDAHKPLLFQEGGGDLLVNLKSHHRGWTNISEDLKKIRYRHIWEGIERMPNSTLVFAPRDQSVTQFRALFEVKQDCQLGDDVEVNVSIPVKQMQPTKTNKEVEQTCPSVPSTNMSRRISANSLQDDTTMTLLEAVQMNNTSSGYFSIGFESWPSGDKLTQRIRSELIIALDPPHPKADWRALAEGLGFERKHITFLEALKPPASPTDVLLNFCELKKFPPSKLAEALRSLGRDDATALLEKQFAVRETEV
ncbi:PREDICTED: netrin receptor UNC5C-like isoform X1 [Acropora digitifera]|uniref:netrin receptor UNC5C-like isoform X1 n=1 Tax=Acropora digitifera TaxID=70779 RepID=UPI00077A791D|nr:PREDICTED: netrin receptor UNC5C-like isoform X1 [Acropora digitifera]